MTFFKKFGAAATIVLAAFIVIDLFLWRSIFLAPSPTIGRNYFLDTTGGGSKLIIFPGNIKILIDADASSGIVDALTHILPGNDRYIDIGIISGVSASHFSGYLSLFDAGFRFGALAYNGRSPDATSTAWTALFDQLKYNHIPIVTLGAGDSITHASDSLAILSPDKDFAQSPDTNDSNFIILTNTGSLKTLFTSGATTNAVNFLLSNKIDLSADVLEVDRGGSLVASSSDILHVVHPNATVIWGAPSKETLSLLGLSPNTKVMRAGEDGTIELWAENTKLYSKVLYNEGK